MIRVVGAGAGGGGGGGGVCVGGVERQNTGSKKSTPASSEDCHAHLMVVVVVVVCVCVCVGGVTVRAGLTWSTER